MSSRWFGNAMLPVGVRQIEVIWTILRGEDSNYQCDNNQKGWKGRSIFEKILQWIILQRVQLKFENKDSYAVWVRESSNSLLKWLFIVQILAYIKF